jgi:hypothetical protein
LVTAGKMNDFDWDRFALDFCRARRAAAAADRP